MAIPTLSSTPSQPGTRAPLSAADEARRIALVGMKRLALGLLVRWP
jgi:hypothetical protein